MVISTKSDENIKLRKFYNVSHFQGNMVGRFYFKYYVDEHTELDDKHGRLSAMGVYSSYRSNIINFKTVPPCTFAHIRGCITYNETR